MKTKEVILISVSEFSMKTAQDIKYKTEQLCSKYDIECELDNKSVLWGGKVSAILEGERENIDTIVKCLKIDFKVKIM